MHNTQVFVQLHVYQRLTVRCVRIDRIVIVSDGFQRDWKKRGGFDSGFLYYRDEVS